MILYHHTSLAHLPYILLDGELVSPPQREGWPRDFVWATRKKMLTPSTRSTNSH